MLLTEFTTLLKNLWEELMNNIKKYIKNIWTIMPMHTKKEKFYLNELKKLEILYVDNYQYIEIKKLNKMTSEQIVEERYKKFRNITSFNVI